MAQDTQASPVDVTPVQFDAEWSLRPWVLGGLLGIAGLLVHLLTEGNQDSRSMMALAAFVFFGSVFAAFTLDRDRWITPIIAAVLGGVIMAGLAWQAIDPNDWWADEEFAFGAGVVAITLSLPLFQAGFHRLRFKTPYRDTHFHIWTDIVSGVGALVFVGLSWALIAILSELFQLLQIDLLRDLMRKEWFGWIFSGLTFGAALGTLRNQLKILGTLQSVVLLVLSLLAVPLAAGLVLFLAAMLVSGPDVLWEATSSATPILLSCAFGAFVLTNAIVRDDDSEMTGSRIMRITALVLALGILPLTVFAAISMGTRVAQHGLSPERIWGLVAIGFACAYGLAYVVAVLRGRRAGWHDALRQANLHLAIGGCVLALIVALPLFDFGAISARDQIARLKSGTVSIEDFDFAALRWDFGEAGRRTLTALTKSDNAEIAKSAKTANDMESRYYGRSQSERRAAAEKSQIEVSDEIIAAAVREFIKSQPYRCYDTCRIVEVGRTSAGPLLALIGRGDADLLAYDEESEEVIEMWIRNGEIVPNRAMDVVSHERSSVIELRSFTGQQLYIDGEPASGAFVQNADE